MPPSPQQIPGALLGALRRRYRATGADGPWGDPLLAHGVAMEGYFWRLTDPATGRVLIALNGVNRSDAGSWSTIGLASHPNGFLRTVVHPTGVADPQRLGVTSGDAFAGSEKSVRLDLGHDARLAVTITDAVPWPRASLGGSSIFQAVPGLNQYWHPWLLGGIARGEAVVGDETWQVDGWTVYAEKNWGKGGFPDAWWWGQAQGFSEPSACVAFAGGQINVGPLRTTVTALVVLLPDGTLVRLGDPVVNPVRARVTDDTWSLRGRSTVGAGPGWSIEVEGTGSLDHAHVLPVPLPAQRLNVPGAIEHLGARMRVTVRRGAQIVWQDESQQAALEHGGIARARAEVRRRGHGPDAVDAPPLR